MKAVAYILWITLALLNLSSQGISEETTQKAKNAAQAYHSENAIEIIQDFRNFLSLPNVASNTSDMMTNANWIIDYLSPRGFTSKIWTAGGAPYVYSERKTKGASKTLLIYAHFDGQPVDVNRWASPPFDPVLRAGIVENEAEVIDWDHALTGEIDPNWRIFARSAGDDKAPIIAIASALDALDKAGIKPSVNIKLILDGEEERGSPTLKSILEKHGKDLSADLMIFGDGPMHQSRRKQLVFGVRGSMTVDLTTYGPVRPLHSGHYGNWAPNPTDRLVQLLVSIKNERGEIIVPGYTRNVTPPTSAEKEAIASMPPIERALQRDLALGSVEGSGNRIELLMMQPAIIVKGLQAGGVGDQARNIISPSATASLNLRLALGQTPAGIRRALETHFFAQGFHIVHNDPDRSELADHAKVLKVDWRPGAYPAFRAALDSPEAVKLSRILNGLKGGGTLLTPTMGGSLPIYLFEQALTDTPIIMLPIANHDNNQHGENENMRLKNLFDAIEIYAAVLADFGQ